MGKKICYLSTGIMDTAFDSQVWPLLETSLKSGFDFIHFAFNPFRHTITERYLQKKEELESIGIQTFYYQQRPPIFRGFIAMDAKRLLPVLMKWWGGGQELVIHCRGHLNAYRGLILKRMNPKLIAVIADLRGAAGDEVGEGRGAIANGFKKYLRKFYQWVESQVVERADLVLCVSNAFKQFLQTNYEIKNLMIIPTYVDTSQFNFSTLIRNLYRENLGISDRTVLVYSGGVAPWQKIEDVVELFLRLKQNVANLFMLFLTQQPFRLKRMINGKIHSNDIKLIQVPHKEVPGYLCASDVGVLLREDKLTNHVAAPIKFSEYMCCGLPCIISANIGDTTEIIRNGNAGIVVDSTKPFPTLSEFQRLLSLNREEISKFGQDKFSSQIYLPRILDLYRILGARELASYE